MPRRKIITNFALAAILREIGEYLEMEGVQFKPRAYEKAAEGLAGLEEDVSELYRQKGLKGLKTIPGVGASIAEKIEEFLETGKIKYHGKLKKTAPVNLSELTKVEGLGPKSVRKLYEKLGVRDLKDLERAAKAGKIRKLAGFGAKSEEKIMKSLSFAKQAGGRKLLGTILPEAQKIEARLKKLEQVERCTLAGSLRRWKETIGDADFLVVSRNPRAVMDYFVQMPEVVQIYAHGPTKSSVRLSLGMDADIRVVPEESYGAALNYFTGSKNHNVVLRQLAIRKGMKLNEYGLFKTSQNGKERLVAGKEEEEVYRALDLQYIEPELRENTGEIELASRNLLPRLVDFGDLKGDLQIQTDWSDGRESIEAMAKAALTRGLKYILITDHTRRLAMTNGLDEERILKQMAEIDRLNRKLAGKITILKGTECDILKDGSMDLPDEILAKLDIVGGAIHSFFGLTQADQTERLLRAMNNPHVDIIFHPTGRIIERRNAYDIDIERVIRTAKATKTVLEVDAYPDRLDLKDEHIRRCVESGVRLSIDSDAHHSRHMEFLKYGIAQARRGFAKKNDIINTRPLPELFKCLKSYDSNNP